MILLASTSDLLRVVTSGTADTDVHASWVDIAAASTPAANRTNTPVITSATTTTVVASPASSTFRTVKTLTIRNKHASASQDVTVLHTDGSTASEIVKATLQAGDALHYYEHFGFIVIDKFGRRKLRDDPLVAASSPAFTTVILGADVTNADATPNTIADVTGLSFAAVSGNTYWFRFFIMYTAAATSTGSRWSINGPSTTLLNYKSEYSLTTTTRTINEGLSTYDAPAACNATSAATAANIAWIEGFATFSATGPVIARFASEVTVSAIVAKAGSILQYQQVL
jgi:hypothetical protein